MALPTPTALTATKRYIPAGRRRVVYVPTIAVKTAPTSSEITAGTDLTGEMSAIAGFDLQGSTQPAQDFASLFAAQVPGINSSSASTITLFTDNLSVDARTLLTIGLSGFIVIFYEGIVTATKCGVFPVTVTGSSPDQVGPDAVAVMTVSFAITSQPAMNVTTPAT